VARLIFPDSVVQTNFTGLSPVLFAKMSPACFRFAFDETAGSRFAGGVGTDSQQVEPTPALAPLRQRLLAANVGGLSAGIFHGNRMKRGFGSNAAKILEINVARKTVFDIFRAPFDRNRCAAILGE